MDGRPAFSITETRILGGQAVDLGPTVDVLTALAGDLSNMNLTVEAIHTETIDGAETAGAVPSFRTRSGSHSATVPRGHSLLLGLSERGEPAGAQAPKRLVVLLTAMAIQANGMPSW